ncbi:DUF6244 family protein [Micromonospora sp. SH-82]|uniref:DUF6244 family protein n=1 Tax=Micromonospora sp. SH-82 TaxID=3132938 RepID=UPI003EBEFC3F
MSLTGTVRADLQAMAAGVARAQQVATTVDQRVEQTAARAVASGFAGVAACLARARQVLGHARSRLVEAADVLSTAYRSVDAVAHQPSPQEIIAALTPVAVAVTAVQGRVTGAGSAVNEARRLVTAVLHGGQPGPTLAGLEQVLELLAAVLRRSTEAREHVEEALARARQIGGTEGPVTGGESHISRPPIPGDAPTTTTDGPTSSELLPAWLSEATRDLPRREAKDPTSGVALIDGQQIPMRSGREPAAAADLKPAYQLIATTTDHLEAKLAARMRREHLTDAAVVTNNPPCDYTPYGCEKILSRLLPAGTRLTVYVRDDDGQVRHWRTYNGNGKAIA